MQPSAGDRPTRTSRPMDPSIAQMTGASQPQHPTQYPSAQPSGPPPNVAAPPGQASMPSAGIQYKGQIAQQAYIPGQSGVSQQQQHVPILPPQYPQGSLPPNMAREQPAPTDMRQSHRLSPSSSQPAINMMATKFSNMTVTGAQTGAQNPVGLLGTPPSIADIKSIPKPLLQPNVESAYCRCTMNKIPKTMSVLTKSALPFGLHVTPFPKPSDDQVPTISGAIVRCRRCRTYINPFVEMIDSGMRWKCNLCYLANDFPSNYDYDPSTQTNVERSSRVELSRPVYEFVAPSEYMVRAPQPAVYLFLIDVSYAAISSGMVATAARVIVDSLDLIPNDSGRSRVGIITYDKAIHFYCMSDQQNEPQMLVVGDIDDVFLPFPDDLLVNLSEGREKIEQIMNLVNKIFEKTQQGASALGPALDAASKLLAPIGGKIIVIQATLPSVGQGALKQRLDPKLLGTPKESQLLQPSSNYYKLFASDCSRSQICVDFFLCPSQYIDIATLSCLSKYTGGHLSFYPGFNASKAEDAIKFAGDLGSFLSKDHGLEAVLRIRASQGIAVSAYHGSFFLRSADLLALPNVNPDHSYSALLTIEENLPSQVACFQTALLYTSCNGERRIRIINMAVMVTEDIKEIFANADQTAIITLLAKMAIDKALNQKLEDARDALVNKCVDIMSGYRTAMGIVQSSQLQISDNLRLLPVMTLALTKNVALRAGEFTQPDVRAYMLTMIKSISVELLTTLIYPNFYSIHTLTEEHGLPDESSGKIVLPPALNLSSEKLERHGLYILDNGLSIIIWVGSAIHPELCQLIFGKPFQELPSGKITLDPINNVWSQKIHNIIAKLCEKHQTRPYVYLIREDAEPALRQIFLSHLYEDKLATQMSYSQFIAFLREKVCPQ